jgi:hypothetical protein
LLFDKNGFSFCKNVPFVPITSKLPKMNTTATGSTDAIMANKTATGGGHAENGAGKKR